MLYGIASVSVVACGEYMLYGIASVSFVACGGVYVIWYSISLCCCLRGEYMLYGIASVSAVACMGSICYMV